MKKTSIILAFTCALASVVVLSLATADDTTPPEQRLAALDKDDAHKGVTQEPRERARGAIERSKRFRAAGDEAHAKLSDRAASAWLAAAEDLVRTGDAEAKAEEARRSAMDAGASSERERALLEETMLQNGRLRAELDQIQRDANPSAMPAAAPGAGASPGDAGAKPPKAPKPPSAPSLPKAKKDGGA